MVDLKGNGTINLPSRSKNSGSPIELALKCSCNYSFWPLDLFRVKLNRNFIRTCYLKLNRDFVRKCYVSNFC